MQHVPFLWMASFTKHDFWGVYTIVWKFYSCLFSVFLHHCPTPFIKRVFIFTYLPWHSCKTSIDHMGVLVYNLRLSSHTFSWLVSPCVKSSNQVDWVRPLHFTSYCFGCSKYFVIPYKFQAEHMHFYSTHTCAHMHTPWEFDLGCVRSTSQFGGNCHLNSIESSKQ